MALPLPRGHPGSRKGLSSRPHGDTVSGGNEHTVSLLSPVLGWEGGHSLAAACLVNQRPTGTRRSPCELAWMAGFLEEVGFLQRMEKQRGDSSHKALSGAKHELWPAPRARKGWEHLDQAPEGSRRCDRTHCPPPITHSKNHSSRKTPMGVGHRSSQ